MEEFKELVSKCGIVMEDDDGRNVLMCVWCVVFVYLGLAICLGEPKLKLYRDINGVLKGDGLCCYLKVESVELALQILDGDDFRGHRIKVERVGRKKILTEFLDSKCAPVGSV